MGNIEKGLQGERVAEKHLIERGFKVVERRFRCKLGEVDLIAEKNKEFYFVEVKTRWSREYGDPLEAITPAKQKQVIKAAQFYIASRRLFDADCHLSAIGVDMSTGEPKVEFIEDAFEVI